MTENTEVKSDKRKNPHAVKFVPPTPELLKAIEADGGIVYVDVPERKTKGGGKRDGYKLPLANHFKALSGLFNNDAKSLLYHCSVTAQALKMAHDLKNSPDAIAKATISKATAKVKNMDTAQIDAMLAALIAAKEAASKTADSTSA